MKNTLYVSGFALSMAVFSASIAFAEGDSGYREESKVKVISQHSNGPAPYHPTYAMVANTTVMIQGYNLRTDDGYVIRVKTAPMRVDLQNLMGPKQGLALDLSKVKFPNGAPTANIVEIEAKIVDCSDNFILFNSQSPQFGKTCPLVMPKSLILYAPNAPFQVFNDPEWLIKVDFKAINGIQLDLVTTVTQKTTCWNPFGRDPDICRPSGGKITKTVPRCELINRRFPMPLLIRKVDEA